MRTRPKTVFSYLGVKLDARDRKLPAEQRRSKWRPNVALCHLLRPQKLVLIHEPRFGDLAELVADDARWAVDYPLEIDLVPLELKDAWAYAEVFTKLHAFVTSWKYESATDYFVHLSTGNNRVQIALFQLVLGNFLPAAPVHTIAPDDPTLPAGTDLDPQWGDLRSDKDDPRLNPDIRAFHTLSELTGLELVERWRGKSNKANALSFEIRGLAKLTKAPILLMGPTGSGKTNLAKEIRADCLPDGPFIPVNCATLVGGTVLSALFGHSRGAFTGAETAHEGFLKQADGGLLFLDEIGELPLIAQAQLLKAIDEKSFYPTGSKSLEKSDFRLVAATNKNLYGSVAEGTFRRDLLARIDVWTFELPGLKELRSEIMGLVETQLGKTPMPLSTAATSIQAMARFTPEARALFEAFALSESATWDGNHRDILATAQRLAVRAAGKGRITPEVVEREIHELKSRWAKPIPPRSDDLVSRYLGPKFAAGYDRFSRVQLEEVLRVCETARSMADASRQLFEAVELGAQRPSKAGRKRIGDKPANETARLKAYLKRNGLEFPLVSFDQLSGHR